MAAVCKRLYRCGEALARAIAARAKSGHGQRSATEFFRGETVVRTGRQNQRPIWPLLITVTLAAVILYLFRERGDGPWPHELGVFVGMWTCIALFAMLGRALFRRRAD